MRIMKLSGALPLAKKQKDEIDLLILSGNPRIYLSQLSNYYNIRKIIFEPSTPKWKTELWKKDCDSLHIPYHDIKEKGAFVMTLR